MKARELAEMLMKDPDKEVLIWDHIEGNHYPASKVVAGTAPFDSCNPPPVLIDVIYIE